MRQTDRFMVRIDRWHVAGLTLRLVFLVSTVSHYGNREPLVRRQATEPHLKDGGIYRKRWWARAYRTANFSVGGLDIDNGYALGLYEDPPAVPDPDAHVMPVYKGHPQERSAAETYGVLPSQDTVTP